MFRRLHTILVPMLLLGLAANTGCSPKNALAPNLPPETTVFVQGPVDTVSYQVHLYWFGTDPDGFVSTYELRFLHPQLPADTQWVRTQRTDSLFNVYTPTGVSQPVFEVRAIDNEAAVDLSPARQAFTFRNLPPTLAIVGGPGANDTTFAAATFTWYATDPDGDIRQATYRTWLDGGEANPAVTTATTLTIPTEQFRQSGLLLSGYRKIFVQAIDAAGYATPPESLRWYVRAPVTGDRARLLIVDDVPGNTGTAGRDDSLYVNTAIRNLPPGTWSMLRLEFTQPFRSTADLEQTLKLFETVIWYRGLQDLQPILTNYRDGVAGYLESGGKLLIETQYLVEGQGATGIFPESWVSQYLGSDFLHKHVTSTSTQDSSVAWGIRSVDTQGNPVILRSTLFADSLRQLVTMGQLRGFAVRDTNHVVAWARAGNLIEGNTIDVPVAVTVPQPGGGRFVALTFSPGRANTFNTVPRFLARVFQHLGLTDTSL